MKRLLYFIVLAATVCAACGTRQNTREELLVGAAANLQFALREIEPAFEREAGIDVIFSWGSTGNLAHQIENGAPFDVFLSANESFMSELTQKGYFDTTGVFPFVTGSLAIGVHESAGKPVKSLAGLADPEIARIAIASPEHAPYGIAAREALENAGLWETLEPRIIYAETIRQCLQFVETGNVPAGIVSANIPPVENVRLVPVDTSLYTPPRQMAGILRRTDNEKAAYAFLRFLAGKKAADALSKYRYRVVINEYFKR